MAGNLREGINVPERRCGSERPIAAMGLWYVMSLAAASAAWAVEAAPSDAAGAPLVVHADRWEPPVRTETDILIHRILQRPSGDFRLDTPQAHELAHEIERVLSRIRDVHPVVKDVPVREKEPWSFMLHLEPICTGKFPGLFPCWTMKVSPFRFVPDMSSSIPSIRNSILQP